MPCQSHAEAKAWSAKAQGKKDDCLAMGYMSFLPEKVSTDLEQNDLSQLEEIWKRIKGNFHGTYKRRVCSSSVQVPCQSHAKAKAWSAKAQGKKGDYPAMGYTSFLPERVSTDLKRNDLSQLEEIWKRIKEPGKQRFTENYGQIAYLILVKVEEPLIRAALQLWDPSHICFTFNKEDLTPTIEKYSTLLQIDLQCPDKIYVRKTNLGFRKKLAKIMKIKSELIDPHTREK